MKTEVRHDKPSLFFPTDPPFDAAYRKGSTETPVGPHLHDAIEFYYTLTPLPDVLIDNRIIAVPADTLIIIPPFCVHQLYHEAGFVYERYVILIQDQWLSNAFCGIPASFPFIESGSHPFFIRLEKESKNDFIEKAEGLLSANMPTSPSALSSLFLFIEFVSDLLPASTHRPSFRQTAAQKRINQIINYINAHIHESLEISDIAEHFFLNPDYLARIFKEHVHISLGHYILLQRITEAQKLLGKGYTVSEVQETLAFSSYAHFFKTFKKITGISPSRYRNVNPSSYHVLLCF